MPVGFLERATIIEECYEFMLAYAAQGLPSDAGSRAGAEVRNSLRRSVEALTGLPESFAASVEQVGLEPVEKYQAFLTVLDRDARDSVAAIELVLAQPSISSQLVDNLNASLHLRALLTDQFLLGEILRQRGAERDDSEAADEAGMQRN
jgi:hypothetical protein